MTYASSGNLARGSGENSCRIQNTPYLIINKCSIYYTNVLSGKRPPLSVKRHKNILAINITDFATKSIRKVPSPNLSVYLVFRVIFLLLFRTYYTYIVSRNC